MRLRKKLLPLTILYDVSNVHFVLKLHSNMNTGHPKLLEFTYNIYFTEKLWKTYANIFLLITFSETTLNKHCILPSRGGWDCKSVNHSLSSDLKSKVVDSNPIFTIIIFSISVIARCIEQCSKLIPEGIDRLIYNGNLLNWSYWIIKAHGTQLDSSNDFIGKFRIKDKGGPSEH